MKAYRNMKELRELLYLKLHSDLFAYINQLSQLAAGNSITEQNHYRSEEATRYLKIILYGI